MKDLLKRTISGVIFVLIIIILLAIDEIGMYILFLFINILCLLEFYNLTYKIRFFPNKLLGISSGILIYTLSFLVASSVIPSRFLILALLCIPLIALPPLLSKASNLFKTWTSTLFGIMYISIPLSLILFIAFSRGNYNYKLILSIFFLIWIYDSFAYLTGINFGRRKILPSVSPKKSWEGAIGGMIFTIGASLILKQVFGMLRTDQWIILAIIIIITGTLGDFAESSLKRIAKMKDSGNIMPGHGGVLDRFDSFLFSVPFIFTYLYLIKF